MGISDCSLDARRMFELAKEATAAGDRLPDGLLEEIERSLPLAREEYVPIGTRWREGPASDFAESGGIAVHRNFDRYHGTLSGRGLRMEKPFLHVIALRAELERWGRRYGLRPEWVQPEKHPGVAHFDLFGLPAVKLLESLGVDR